MISINQFFFQEGITVYCRKFLFMEISSVNFIHLLDLITLSHAMLPGLIRHFWVANRAGPENDNI